MHSLRGPTVANSVTGPYKLVPKIAKTSCNNAQAPRFAPVHELLMPFAFAAGVFLCVYVDVASRVALLALCFERSCPGFMPSFPTSAVLPDFRCVDPFFSWRNRGPWNPLREQSIHGCPWPNHDEICRAPGTLLRGDGPAAVVPTTSSSSLNPKNLLTCALRDPPPRLAGP